MSLFGEESPAETPTRGTKNPSLFAAESPSRPSGGLFADDTPSAGDSPWSLPTPKRAARSTLIKTLLPAGEVPEAYVDVCDKLLAEGDGAVGAKEVNKLIADSGVDAAAGRKIRETVVTGHGHGQTLARGEVNVLLALIGLAQEGEDITLDGVDERRRNLPIPKLASLTGAKQQSKPASETTTEAGAQEPASTDSRPSTAPKTSNPEQPRTVRKQSFGFPDTDPWSSPDLHRGHQHSGTNGTGAQTSLPTSTIGPTRTTSAFTTHSHTESTDNPVSPPTRQSTSSEVGWGGFAGGAADTFRNPGLGGGFDDASGGDGNNPTGSANAPFIAPRIPPASQDEVITVTSLPEKEGMFLFQHRNYQVSSARRNSKVIRRYSDFVWLLDCLHKRNPFRQLPLLPPKRVAINGNHLAADSSFIEKRRRGLARFANALVRHPVLSQEQLVIMFLTVPTELAVWRKQASISVQEEFIGKSLPPTLEDSLSPNLQDIFDRVRTGVRRSAEQYINLCNYFERLSKRNEGMAAEHLRVANSFQALTAVSSDTYAADSGDIIGLNMGLTAAAKHVSAAQSLLEDEARAWDEGVLEDLKRQRDCLVSIRDMFDRRDRYDRDNIPQLERRIKSNEEKLNSIRNKPEGSVKPGEAERVEDAILKDKQSIVDQHVRGVFIKECIRDEIGFFQSSQYQLSRLQQDWAAERVKYAELQAENWRALADEVESMPLGEP